MNSEDKELVLKVSKSNAQLKRLYTQHSDIDSKLKAFENKAYLTADEQMLEKRLKREKLQKKDQMMELLAACQ